MRALDLFCGAGGASMGLHRAGFEVVGIDHKPQPRYPFKFIQADALRPPVRLEDFDLIWASPPCQAYSAATVIHPHLRGTHPELVGPVRSMLESASVPFIIENVVGAPLRRDFALSGPMFGLKVIRRRIFETTFFGLHPPHWQPRNAVVSGEYVTVAGHGAPYRRGGPAARVERWRVAMGIDWMTRDELSQAIPPAYSEFIARAFLASHAADRG